MKKILPILLSILMVFSLAACAGNNDAPSENDTQDSTPAVSTNENKTEPSNTPVINGSVENMADYDIVSWINGLDLDVKAE